MSERDAFLRAITTEPADDTARLVFADWLEEHGEPERAELIRVQCELCRKPECPEWCNHEPEHCRVAWLECRERELLTANEHRWRTEPKCELCVGSGEVTLASIAGGRRATHTCQAC